MEGKMSCQYPEICSPFKVGMNPGPGKVRWLPFLFGKYSYPLPNKLGR